MEKTNSSYDFPITDKMLAAVLVKNNTNEWFRFDLWEDRIFIMTRREEYQNWEDYDDGYNDEDVEELHSIYLAMYQRPALKNAPKKTLTKAIWGKLYMRANDRSTTYRTGAVINDHTGQRERKRSLDRRGYRAIEGSNDVHMQNQAIIVHRALIGLHQDSNKEFVSESDVRELMDRLRDSGLLKTKQDPFRIFQYYRPALIKAGKLEFVE